MNTELELITKENQQIMVDIEKLNSDQEAQRAHRENLIVQESKHLKDSKIHLILSLF